MSEQVAVPAVFMRGGTSKALIFHRRDLPHDRNSWAALFLAALNSPDPNGRQLDGMGGGLSSLSKICIVEPSARADADVDYTFAQVLVDRAEVDYSANCGNMSSAIGPFAVDEALVGAPADGVATVRIRNTNTDKIIVSSFAVEDGRAVIAGAHRVDGVAGSGAPIRLDFLRPGGAATGALLPTGRVQDTAHVRGLGDIPFSLVDAGNPVIFIAGSSVLASGAESPAEIEAAPGLLDRLELVRRHGAVAAGAAPDLDSAGATAIPRIAMVARADAGLAGEGVGAAQGDILVRVISRGRPHRAVTVTGGLCLAVACRLPGSVPHALLAAGARDRDGDIRIGHPGGALRVAASVVDGAGGPQAERACVYLTARRLFQGEVLVPASRLTRPAGRPGG